MTTQTPVNTIQLDKMTKAQFDALATKDQTHLYVITDESADGLPDQTGHAGQYLKTDGTNASWEDVKSAYDWIGTKEEYDALETHDPDKIYYITDDYNGGSSAVVDRFVRGVAKIRQSSFLEISGNTLTVKANTVAYVPNGRDSESSLLVESRKITSDMTYSPTDLTGEEYIVYNYTENTLDHTPVSSTLTLEDGYSVTEAVSMAYISETNYIRKTTDTGSTWSTSNYSLPLCIVKSEGGKITCIKQVFNGATCLGRTIFVRNGYTLRIPNGFDPDTHMPRYINHVFDINRLVTITGNFSIYAELDGPDDTYASIGQCNNSLVYCQEIPPDYRNTMIWYNPLANHYYFTTDGGKTWEIVYLEFMTHVNQLGSTNYIKYFHPMAEATYLTTDDMRLVTHWAYPSAWRTTVTPTNGGIYTAPADGYFYLSVSRGSSTDAFAKITGWETNYVASSYCAAVGTTDATTADVIMPVSSGNSVIMNFAGTVERCGFYYCNGGFVA